MGFYVFGQVASIAEILIVVRFLISLFGWKVQTGKRYRHLLEGAVVSLVLYALAQMNGRYRFSHFAVIVVDIALLYLFCRICLKGSRQLHFMGSVLPFLAVTVGNLIIMQMMAAARKMDVSGYLVTENAWFIVGTILSKLSLFVCLEVFLHLFSRREVFLSKRYHRMVNGVCVFMVILELLFFYAINLKPYQRTANTLLILISVGMAVTAAYIAYSIYTVSCKNEELMQMNLIRLEEQEMAHRLREMEYAHLRERQLIHDYRNHCLCVSEMIRNGAYAGAESYLTKLVGTKLRELQPTEYTGNELLDALLSRKRSICEEKGILFYVTVVGAVGSGCRQEIASILFNLLDNAIEAGEREPDGARVIEVEIYSREQTLEIYVRNRISESILQKNPELISDKAGDGHGIGLRSVELCVNQMDGMSDFYEKYGMFCAHIIIGKTLAF